MVVMEDPFSILSGETTIFEGQQIESQVQYNFDLADEKFNFILGTDYRLNTIDTKKTIHGRWEDKDNYTIFGAYGQAEIKLGKQLDLIAAVRIDRFVALKESAFSPRVGLLYKPTPKHTMRLTFNRAIGAPPAINLYADFPITNHGPFITHLLGGADPITFDDPQTTSLIPSIGLTNGIGMNLGATYAYITNQLVEAKIITAELGAHLLSLSGRYPRFFLQARSVKI